jgi:hypothetical protein
MEKYSKRAHQILNFSPTCNIFFNNFYIHYNVASLVSNSLTTQLPHSVYLSPRVNNLLFFSFLNKILYFSRMSLYVKFGDDWINRSGQFFSYKIQTKWVNISIVKIVLFWNEPLCKIWWRLDKQKLSNFFLRNSNKVS